jgi:hypothetical protein
MAGVQISQCRSQQGPGRLAHDLNRLFRDSLAMCVSQVSASMPAALLIERASMAARLWQVSASRSDSLQAHHLVEFNLYHRALQIRPL